MSLRKSLLFVGLVIGVVALMLVPAGCNLFKSTLTIANQASTVEIDFVQWTDDKGTTYDYGDDLVWDYNLGDWEYGLAPGDSSSRKVGAGSDYVYFFYTTSVVGYRTTSTVTVATFDDTSFTFYDTTLVVARQSASGETTTEVYDVVPSGRVKPGTE